LGVTARVPAQPSFLKRYGAISMRRQVRTPDASWTSPMNAEEEGVVYPMDRTRAMKTKGLGIWGLGLRSSGVRVRDLRDKVKGLGLRSSGVRVWDLELGG
jgi:hypothetical protein